MVKKVILCLISGSLALGGSPALGARNNKPVFKQQVTSNNVQINKNLVQNPVFQINQQTQGQQPQNQVQDNKIKNTPEIQKKIESKEQKNQIQKQGETNKNAFACIWHTCKNKVFSLNTYKNLALSIMTGKAAVLTSTAIAGIPVLGSMPFVGPTLGFMGGIYGAGLCGALAYSCLPSILLPSPEPEAKKGNVEHITEFVTDHAIECGVSEVLPFEPMSLQDKLLNFGFLYGVSYLLNNKKESNNNQN